MCQAYRQNEPRLLFLCEPHSHGNVAQTQTPTVCCKSTSQKARVCRYIVEQSKVQLPDSSLCNLERRWEALAERFNACVAPIS